MSYEDIRRQLRASVGEDKDEEARMRYARQDQQRRQQGQQQQQERKNTSAQANQGRGGSEAFQQWLIDMQSKQGPLANYLSTQGMKDYVSRPISREERVQSVIDNLNDDSWGSYQRDSLGKADLGYLIRQADNLTAEMMKRGDRMAYQNTKDYADWLRNLQGLYDDRASYFGQFQNEDEYKLVRGVQAGQDQAAARGESYNDYYQRTAQGAARANEAYQAAQQQKAQLQQDLVQMNNYYYASGQVIANGKVLKGQEAEAYIQQKRDELAYLDQDIQQKAHDAQYAEQVASYAEMGRYSDLKGRDDFQEKVAAGMEAFQRDKANREAGNLRDEDVAMTFANAGGTNGALNAMGAVANTALRQDRSAEEPGKGWSKEDLDQFFYLYANNPTEAGERARSLNARDRALQYNQQAKGVEDWTNQSGWNRLAAWGAGVLSSPANLADYYARAMEYSARGYVMPHDEMTAADYANTMSAAAARYLNDTYKLPEQVPVLGGKGLGDAFQLSQSIAQSAATAMLGGGATNLLFFGSAANQTFADAKARGASDGQALILGALSGAAEVLGETLSVEHLIDLKDPAGLRQTIGNIFAQSGIEASEEAFTTVMNRWADELVMRDKGELQQAIRDNMAKGMSPEEAEKTAWREWTEGVLFDAFGGFLSGGISAGGKMGISSAIHSGSAYSGGIQTRGMSKEERQDLRKYTAQEVINYGKLADDGTKARSMADKAQARLDKKGSITNRQATKLSNETAKAIRSADRTTLEDAVRARLQQTGEMSAADLDRTAKSIVDRVTGDKTGGAWISSQEMRVYNELEAQLSGVSSENWLQADKLKTNQAREQKMQSIRNLELKDSGKTVKVTHAEMKDGKLAFAYMEDGKEKVASQEDLKLDTAQADTLKMLTQILGEDAAAAYNTMNVGTMAFGDVFDVMRYASAFATVRDVFGATGVSETRMLASSLRNGLTNGQALQAWTIGKNRGAELRTEQKQSRAGTGEVSLDGTTIRHKDGSTTTFKAVKGQEKVRKSKKFQAVQAIAEALKIDMVLYDGEGGQNIGMYGNGVIYLDWTAMQSEDAKSADWVMFRTLSHELTHFIQQNAKKEYQELRSYITKYLSESKNLDFNDLVAQKMSREYDPETGRLLSYEKAVDEVMADACETMLRDSQYVQELMQEHQSLWEKIRNFIRNFLRKIEASDAAAKELQPVVQELREIWDRGLKTAVESRTDTETGVAEMTNAKGETVAVASEETGGMQMSIRTYNEGGKQALRTFLDQQVKKGALTSQEAAEIRSQIETLYQVCKDYDNGKYAPFSAWSNASVVSYDGRPVFSVVKANGEYKLNLDFSLVCKKRRTLDAVFNEMISQGIMDDFDMVQESIAKINDIIRENGFETACGLCFVDSKRYRQGMIADAFVGMYNMQVMSLVKSGAGQKVDYFNYGGDQTKQNTGHGIDTLPDDQLDWTKIDKILQTEKKTTVRWKIANYLKNNPSARRRVMRGDFMSTAGFDAVKAKNPELLSLYNSKKGAGGPKAAQSDVQYLNEIINQNMFNEKSAYEVGGVRIQSFSDYVGRLVFDYVQMVADLSAKKLPAHSYTKEFMFAQQFGLTGIKINMSLVPEVIKGGVAAGLDANGNYAWKDGQSFGSTVYDNKGKRLTAAEGFELAKRIQNAEGYSKNCGTIAVGVSDEHIRKMLDDPEIRMIIPYHKSSLNHIVAAMMNIDKYTDYTLQQNTRERKGSKWVNIPKGQEFNFNEALQRLGDAKAAANEYLAWCRENGYKPKFDQFADNANYYKVLEDFSCYDKDGVTNTPLSAVQMKFPGEGDAFGSMSELIEQGLEEDAILQAKQEQAVPEIVKQIQAVLPEFEGTVRERNAKKGKKGNKKAAVVNDDELQRSVQDREYMDAVKSGDMETAQRMVDEAAKAAGYNRRAFHGTVSQFWTFRRGNEGIHFGTLEQAQQTLEKDRGRHTYQSYPVGTVAENLDRFNKAQLEEIAYDIEAFKWSGMPDLPEVDSNMFWKRSEEDVRQYVRDYVNKAFELDPGLRKTGKITTKPLFDEYKDRMIDAYVKMQHVMSVPVDIGEWSTIRIADALLKKLNGQEDSYYSYNREKNTGDYEPWYPGDITGIELTEADRPELERLSKLWTDFEGIAEFLKSKGVDSIEYINQYEGPVDATSYLLLDPEQVKLADPVTYDDNGEVIPLSQRFDVDEGDIRYSTKKEVLATKGVDWMGDFTSIKDQLKKHRADIERAFNKQPLVEVEYGGEKDAELDALILAQALEVGDPDEDWQSAFFDRDGVTFDFDINGAKSIRSHASANLALRAAALAAPHILKKGILIAGQKNHENTGLTTLTYAGPAVIDGTLVNVGVVVQFQDDGKPRAVNVETSEGGTFVIKKEKAAKRNRGRVDESPGTTPPRKATSSVITIPQDTEEINDDLQKSVKNLGYHAGDLGKAEHLNIQGRYRGTGHFGTGTYFVGEEEKVTKDSYYGKRPQHAVDFTDYNLFKVRNDQAGYQLHDALRIIDGGIKREWIHPALDNQFNIIKPTGYYDLAKSKYGEDWARGGNMLNAMLEYAADNGISIKTLDEYKADEGFASDDSDAMDYYEDYVKDALKEEIDKVNAAYREFSNMVFDLHILPGFTKGKISSALTAVADYQDATPRNARADSYATVFMKAMGYDGVDVRGTRLDNTEYGSVIYDVKPETVAYSVRSDNRTDRELLRDLYDRIEAKVEARAKRNEAGLNKAYQKMVRDKQSVIEEMKAEQAKALETFLKRQERYDGAMRAVSIEMTKLENLVNAGANQKAISEQRAKVTAAETRLANATAALTQARDSEAIQKILARERQIQRDRTRNTIRESVNSREMKRRVTRAAGELYEMLATNSDKLHVPEILKEPLGDFLQSLDFTSKRVLAGGEETKADQRFGARLQQIRNILENQQRYLNGEEAAAQDLGGYLDISEDSLQFLRDCAFMINQAMAENRGYTINQMNAEQLRDLANFLANLKSAIRKMNSFMANERYASVREAADADITEMEAMGRAGNLAENRALNEFLWKNGTPYYIFKRMGAGAESIFQGFARGWAQMAFDARRIIDFTEQAYTDKEVKQWKKETHDFTLEDGSKITMTTAQIMELSQLLGRQQAVQHLQAGGMRIGDIQTRTGAKGDSRHYHLTGNDLQQILGALSERQMKVARDLQHFMAEQGAEWGNEVSMKRFGYRFYTEGQGYYPIVTDDLDRPMADTDAQNNSMFRLLNLSSSHSLEPKANNALVVGDIFDTFTDHMADMAKLHGMGLPILDAIKWFNFKEKTKNEDGTIDTRTLQGAMKQAFGSAAGSYFRTMIKDINGQTENGDRGTGLANMAIGAYKAQAVAANLRVALLQPTAYLRAATVLKPKYMLAAFGNFKASIFAVRAAEAAWKEAMQHSGEMIWKDIGGYDTDLSRSMRSQIQHSDSVREKIVNGSMFLAEWGDKLTWGRLWAACKLQAKAENKALTGQTLMEATEKLFREVIYSSQVMDSTLTRSELMRGRTMGSKVLTAFMAEPTLSVNIVMDAASEYHNDTRKYGKAEAWKRNGKRIGKAFMIYLTTQTAAALVESFADALRDDDDEELWKKYLEALLGEDNAKRILGEELGKNAKGVLMSAYADGNLLQDYLFLNKLPFIKDLASLLTGFKSRNMMTEGAENLLNVYKIWRETKQLADGVLEKPTQVTYYGKMTPWGRIYKSLQAVSQLSGTPLYGLSRDVVAIWNTIMNGRKDEWKIRTYDDSKSTDKLLAALRSGKDTSEARAKLIAAGMDENDINSKVRSEVKAMFLGDDKKEGISEEDAVRLLVDEAGMRQRDAEKQVQNWSSEKDTGVKYDDIKEKYLAGDITAEEAERMRMEYGGQKEEAAHAAIREWECEKETGFKYDELDDAFLDGDITEKQAVAYRIEYGGQDPEAAQKTVNKWKCEKETGYRYDEIRENYVSGKLSRDKAADMMVKYGGKERDSALKTLYRYQFVGTDESLEGITEAAAVHYYADIYESGMSKKTFFSAWSDLKEFKGDLDANGKSVPYSKMDKMIDYIGKLSIPDAQKDLLFLMYYDKKQLSRTSWH